MKLNWKEDVLGAVWKELERETGGGYDISLHNCEILKRKKKFLREAWGTPL